MFKFLKARQARKNLATNVTAYNRLIARHEEWSKTDLGEYQKLSGLGAAVSMRFLRSAEKHADAARDARNALISLIMAEDTYGDYQIIDGSVVAK